MRTFVSFIKKYSQIQIKIISIFKGCFYFTAAVATSTGNNPAPTNVIEYIYMTFSWMMGVFVFALLLGQIRDIVSNANKNNEEFRTTMDKVSQKCGKYTVN